MAETKKCQKCSGTKYYNEGISKKNNKPYRNWKCPGCGDIEWLRDEPQKVNSFGAYGKEPNWDAIRQRKEEGMEFLNAKKNAGVIVAAAIQSGQLKLEDYFNAFKKITEEIYGFNDTGE